MYLESPSIGLLQNKRGPKAKKRQILHPKAMRVDQLSQDVETTWQTITLRPSERGHLKAKFTRRRVWVVDDDLTVTELRVGRFVPDPDSDIMPRFELG